MAKPQPGRQAELAVVVLAAGQGKRMRSKLPKVLHPLAGRPLLAHVLETVGLLRPAGVFVVVGHQAEQVRAAIRAQVRWVEQAEQRGTGHAAAQALPFLNEDALALVLCGDVPLVSPCTLRACIAAAGDGLALVTAQPSEPGALGRIKRNASGRIEGIVEFRDATPEEQGIQEVNAGILALPGGLLKQLLAEVTPSNAQGECYLTDTVGLAAARGIAVTGVAAANAEEILGVNDRAELAALERIWQRRATRKLLLEGVGMADPERVDIRGEVRAGQDCFIDANVVLAGKVTLGDGVYLGPGVLIEDAVLGDGARVEAHSLVQGARVAAHCRLGPFARIRPGTELGEGTQIGNFVETKKARLGRGVKANHLAYLGDAELGDGCNVGAGAITCNYDGAAKHRTTIGDDVFLGTNSSLVAPLSIESGAFIAAGSTITREVARGELAVARGQQRNIQGWRRPGEPKSEE